MNRTESKRNIRHARVRAKVKGTEARPRFSVYRSLAFIYAQLIDDTTGRTLIALDDRELKEKTKVFRARALGAAIAKEAKAKGITKVVFDRAGYIYTGRIRALAEGAREGGLEF